MQDINCQKCGKKNGEQNMADGELEIRCKQTKCRYIIRVVCVNSVCWYEKIAPVDNFFIPHR